MSELDVSNGLKPLMQTIEPIVVSVPLLELLLIRETAYRAEQTIDKAEHSLKLLGHQLLRDRELAHEARAILRAYTNRPTTEDAEDDSEIKHLPSKPCQRCGRLTNGGERWCHQCCQESPACPFCGLLLAPGLSRCPRCFPGPVDHPVAPSPSPET